MLIAAGLVASAALAEPVAGPAERGATLEIAAEPIAVPGTLHRSVTARGAWHLTAGHPEFGGISGLLIEDGQLTAITDRGHWLESRIALEGQRLSFSEARIAPITDQDGSLLGWPGGDAEGLTRLGPDLLVSFEHDPRILRHLGGGRMGKGTRAAAFERMPPNDGLEGLARLPDGSVIAIGEEPGPGGFPMWRLMPDGSLRESALAQRSRHHVTGAETGPATEEGARLYVVQRHFTPATGVSIRLLAYPLGPDGWPDARLVTELAAWESASGIDNMEGVAVTPEPDGGALIWIVSDDNFNVPQRTILVVLALAPPPG